MADFCLFYARGKFHKSFKLSFFTRYLLKHELEIKNLSMSIKNYRTLISIWNYSKKTITRFLFASKVKIAFCARLHTVMHNRKFVTISMAIWFTQADLESMFCTKVTRNEWNDLWNRFFLLFWQSFVCLFHKSYSYISMHKLQLQKQNTKCI